MSLPQKFICAILLSGFASSAIAAELPVESANSDLDKIVAVYKSGHLVESVALAQKAAAASPNGWQAHALLSYLAWQQGNAIEAVEQGQQAVKIAPDSLLASLNLAKIEEALSDFKDSIDIYSKAENLDPHDHEASLGLARSFLKSSQKEAGLAKLKKLRDDNKSSFDLQLKIADLYLQSGEAKLAVEASRDALKNAEKPAQLASASNVLLLALLRADDFSGAEALKQDVFKNYNPDNYELYVRAASALLKPGESEFAKVIFESAKRNLNKEDSADGFYRLGRIFQDKASQLQSQICEAKSLKSGGTETSSQYDAWMSLAEAAYKKAIELDGMPARYHLCVAGIEGQSGKIKEMQDELNKAKSVEALDTVAPFLLSVASKEGASVKEGEPLPCHVSKIDFKVSGLSCNCHVAKVEAAFSKIKGIAAVTILRDDSREGVMLIDETQTKAEDAFAQCIKSFEGAPELKAKTPLGLEFISRKPVEGADEIVRIAQNSRYGGVLEFYNQFKVVDPVLPLQNQQAISAK